jgi:tetratricopeptide (TPR) repeat protein
MRPQSRVVQGGIALIAAVLLLTGALNLRSAIGRDARGNWEVDPAAPSRIDLLAGVSQRLQGELDQQILAYQEQLRVDSNDGSAAVLLGQAYLQKARETGDPSYYPKADTLFQMAFDLNDQDYSAAAGIGTVALVRHEFDLALEWGERAKAINRYSPDPYGVMGTH